MFVMKKMNNNNNRSETKRKYLVRNVLNIMN